MTGSLISVAKSKNGTPLYECVCPDCGCVRIQDKRKIGTRCVPCAAALRKTHGLSNTPLYRLWSGMVARCTYPSVTHYKYYGGRGIDVCEEWRTNKESFFKWALENGYQKGLELDREDPNGNYEPGNCRFLTHKVNSQLRRNAKCTAEKAIEIKRLLADGMKVKAIAAETGVPYMSVWHIDKGNTWK